MFSHRRRGDVVDVHVDHDRSTEPAERDAVLDVVRRTVRATLTSTP